MINFGKRLKMLRKEAGVSQSYIADHIGVSTQSVSNWECENTMPDISQIVPLAALLSISTDYLLGVGTNEKTDKAELKKKVDQVWATSSVNSAENNADLQVYELYKEYLNKYPLDYAVKYKCALAIKDYLYVAVVRNKFDISDEDIEKYFNECDTMLRLICDNCTLPEIQIDAENCLVELLILKGKWDEAVSIAMRLPNIYGIRDKALRTIALAKGESKTSNEKSESVCKYLMLEYANALFYRAKTVSDNLESKKTVVLAAWSDMENASKELIRLYLSASDLAVNAYEANPFCYLITAYVSKSNYLICQGDIDDALLCTENAANCAVEMFTWAKQNCKDSLVMSDILYFAQHTPRWCYKWAESENSKAFTCHNRFEECLNKVSNLTM